MNLSAWILRRAGWTVNVTVDDPPKSLIVVAPHTSNWDFVICILASWAVNRKIGFLMKESWFFFPFNLLFKALGGIPVPRKKPHGSLTDSVIEKFNSSDRLCVAITPEGTRSLTDKWHTGFLRIAMGAHVPVYLAALDFATKRVLLEKEFYPTGDIDADMSEIKKYYSQFQGKYPEKFSAGK